MGWGEVVHMIRAPGKGRVGYGREGLGGVV